LIATHCPKIKKWTPVSSSRRGDLPPDRPTNTFSECVEFLSDQAATAEGGSRLSVQRFGIDFRRPGEVVSGTYLTALKRRLIVKCQLNVSLG
jgi:hypothetical protein